MASSKVTVKLHIDPNVETLTRQVARAMVAADLDMALGDMERRFQESRRIVTATAGSVKDGVAVGLEPFAELVLRSSLDIAQSSASQDEKTKQIGELLDMAGY